MLHIIHKHKIILKLREEKGAWKLQDRVSNLYINNLAQLLEPIFDSAASSEEYVRIEKLELDLGNIRQDNFESHFKERLLSEFSKALGEVRHSSSENVKVVKSNKTNLDSFIFFLEYGYLPWYSKFEGFSNWETKLKSALTSADWSYFLKWLEKEIESSSASIDRIIFQFSDEFLTFLTNQSQTGKDFNLFFFNDIVSLVTAFSNETRSSLRLNTWKTTIVQFLKASNKEEAVSAIIQSSIIIPTFLSLLNSKPEWRKKIKKILSSGSSEDSLFDDILSFLISKESASTDGTSRSKETSRFSIHSEVVKSCFIKLISQLVEASASDKNTDRANRDKVGSIKKSRPLSSKKNSTDKNLSDKKNEESMGMNDSLHLIKKDTDQSILPLPPTPPPLKKRTKKTLEFEKAGIIVSNCGIVLLHPFFKAYFTGIDIYSNNAFSTPENQQRAVLLLNYLGTGNRDAAEVDLVFQKLLCGMNIDEPLPNTFELTDKEVAESKNLLNAVINHWAPLNRTSAAGLQSTFFQREGKLTKTDNGWRVFIENKTIDILLDKLPWGYSTIKLPWMKELLNVDWR